MTSKTIWVARPAPGDCGQDQILPVNWDAIAHGGITDTNYQILPGDRVYIATTALVAVERLHLEVRQSDRAAAWHRFAGRDTIRDAEGLGREYNELQSGRRFLNRVQSPFG